MWFESTAAHHPIHNANRGRRDPEGRDDFLPAIDLDAGDELLKERFRCWRLGRGR